MKLEIINRINTEVVGMGQHGFIFILLVITGPVFTNILISLLG